MSHDEPRRLLVLVMMALAVTLVGCAAGPEKTDEPEAEPTSTATAPAFGDDAVGAALAWADAPPDDLPEAVAGRLDQWDQPLLLRLFRLSDAEARAVIGRQDGKDRPAVLLRLRRTEGGWRVVGSEPTTANHGWPTM